ncbi:hypothetical protein [Tissierella sp.]|uniref:hypothetical protein n=1 Tax=Tissierella sp. TaxID=41274 RepID=UPI002857A525|nr:hypothetical protein [Tissierella sp.]MDR7857734.1 hypothetical protein [Tissierella sp.]
MKKGIILIMFIFSSILLLSCEKQDYKRIIVEDNIGVESKSPLEASSFGQIYLEVDSSDYFYPSFYHKGEIYGYLKKRNGNDPNSRKYLYKLDINNRLTETLKENMNFKLGSKNFVFLKEQVYFIDYTKRSRATPIPELSKIISELRQKRKESQYKIAYASGSDIYLIIYEISLDGKITDVFLYDLELKNLYRDINNSGYGDICYVHELNSLIWIDQMDFKMYKVQLENNYYTLKEYIDLGVNEDIDKVRGIMKNGYELILLHDVILGNKDDWNLKETSAITSFNFKTNQYDHLFSKPLDKNLYMEYLGQGIFIAESFDIFGEYIEITERSIYYQNYNELIQVYNESFQDTSQQFYPEMNVVVDETGNEIFSTREINKIIGGIPVTKSIIYQRINIVLPNMNLKPN